MRMIFWAVVLLLVGASFSTTIHKFLKFLPNV